MNTANDSQVWEVAIIGGGSAGLSAASTLARARRSVLAIDGGQPRNVPAVAVHGLLGLEGINPLQLLTKAREEVSSYGAHIVHTDVVDASGSADRGFRLALDDGSIVQADQLLIATGVRDALPAVPGLAERWGKDVVHCPYCHGWEISDQQIGLVATGSMSAMQALLFHQWSNHLWFFPNGLEFPADQLDMLSAVAIPSRTHARLDGLDGLGIEVAVVAETTGSTSLPGVWAAGNVVNPGMQVSEAAANGARVAMTINTELVFAQAKRAVAAAENTPMEVV